MAEEGTCALLLLAAGGSSRMGQPKQLLMIEGESLIRRMARIALAAMLQPNIVVLGAHAPLIRPQLADLPLTLIDNPLWQEGVSSSIRAGVRAILDSEMPVRGLIVALADQPRLSAAQLIDIESAQRASARSIVACDYGDHVGPPAYFGRTHFEALEALRGDVGARELLQSADAQLISAPAGAGEDLDSSTDYARLLESPPVNR